MGTMRMELHELLSEFYDVAEAHPSESLAQIKRRVFHGKPWPTKTFEREAKYMYRVAHMPDPDAKR
jgi:hypothetical protein